jgi:hypothetical protein
MDAATASRDFERKDTCEEAVKAVGDLKAKGMQVNELSPTESMGFARIISSMSTEIRLRKFIDVGLRKVSPTEMVGKSSRKPSVANTPSLMASLSSGRLRWQGLKPLADWAIPTTGRLAISFEYPAAWANVCLR